MTQPQQFDPEAFAAVLASKCAPGVLDNLLASDDTARKTEKLIDYMEYEGQGAWQRESHLELLCEKLEKEVPFSG